MAAGRHVSAVSAPDNAQRLAARLTGFFYLVAIPPALFAEFAVQAQLSGDNALETARLIAAHEQLFRLGIAANLIAFLLDVGLITAIYAVLKPVNPGLARAALVFRLIETMLLVSVVLYDLEALRIAGSTPYLAGVSPDVRAGLARAALGGHASAYNVALVFFGCGSTLFGYLWFKSRYVPRWLAGFGLSASVVAGVATFAFIVAPALHTTITIAYYGGPIFIFELLMGFWLLFAGIGRKQAIAA